MSRRRRVVIVCLAGLAAAVIAHFAGAEAQTVSLILLATGLVLGELLVLRLEDGSAIPLSFSLLVVLASSFTFPQYAAVVLGAELISLVLRVSDRSTRSAPRDLRGAPRGRGSDVRRVSAHVARGRRTGDRCRGSRVAGGGGGRAGRCRRFVAAGVASRHVVLSARPARVAGGCVLGHVDGRRLSRC